MVRTQGPQILPAPLPRRSDEGGVILVTVILILSAILILVLPLAFLTKRGEERAFTSLETSEARSYARLALNHTKRRLRMGIYENEYYYTYPRPTASPTATPEYIVDKQPYDSPFFDGPAELYFDRVFDWDEIFGEGALRDPKGVALGVEVEDEQGKLNANSLSPEILLGLLLVANRIEPESLSAAESEALLEFAERVLTPTALLRIADAAVYAPVSSVAELAAVYDVEDDQYYSLTESDFDALRPFLTTSSWRQRSWGFQTWGYGVSTGTDGKEWVGGDVVLVVQEKCVYRIEAVDEDDNVLMALYAIPELSGSSLTITVEDVPVEATAVRAFAEEFHPVNINTTSREVLAAFMMSLYDFENPLWTTADAVDLAARMKPNVRALGLSDNGSGYDVALDPNSEYELIPENLPWTFSVGGIYCNGTRSGSKLAVSAEEGERLAMYALPLSVFPVFKPDSFSAPVYLLALSAATELDAELTTAFRGLLTREVDGPQAFFTTVGYDCYTIKVNVSMNTPEGLQTAAWSIEETVELGLSEMLKEPLAIDTLADFQDSLRSTTANGFPRKFRPYRKHSTGHAVARQLSPGPATIAETSPPGQVIEWYAGSYRQETHLARQWLPQPTTYSANFNNHAMAQVNSGIQTAVMLTDGSWPLLSGIGPAASYRYSGIGNASGEMWIKVPDWDLVASSTPMPLYNLKEHIQLGFSSDPTVKSEPAAELFIADSKLSLKVFDAVGQWGQIDYALTEQNFPTDTWMHVLFHFAGNQQDQMALMVDYRLVPVTYSASSEPGWNLSFAHLARTTPALNLPLAAGDLEASVDSTESFPDSGWLRIGEEVIYYTAKTDTTFTGLVRAVGGTTASSHAAGAKFYQVLKASQSTPFNTAPKTSDEVVLLGTALQAARESFTLDMDSFYDTDRHVWLLSIPDGHLFVNSSPITTATAFCRVSGSCGPLVNLDVTRFQVSYLWDSDGVVFPGECKEVIHRRPSGPISWTSTAMDASTNGAPSLNEFSLSSSIPRVYKIGDELIAWALYGNTVTANRGFLGTQAADHPAGSWAIPMDSIECKLLPAAISASDWDMLYDGWSVPTGVYRLDDELIYFRYLGNKTVGEYTYRHIMLVRGYMGSTAAAHDANTIMVRYYPPNPILYKTDGPEELQHDFVQFIRRSSSTRYLGLTWSTLNPDPYIRCHAWLTTKWRDEFPTLNLPDLFHFADGMSDFGIAREDGSFAMSDLCLIRFTAEYLQGAWLPNDATRHSWKRAPTLDRIDLWIEQPDTVYRHIEGPR